MTSAEKRAVSALAGIFALRMLGLFLILPVFSLYAHGLQGTTDLLAGLALGAYGLTQALLQIPFGMLSDRFGRKPVIAAGLLVFAAGSVVAALAGDIVTVIIGRALQGAGAIAAAVLALTADLTREDQRAKAMAIIGMSIGLAFVTALVLGPLLSAWIGVPGIFWLTFALALGALPVLWWAVPTPVRSVAHRDVQTMPGQFGQVLRDPQLLRLDLGIFALHLVLTAMFVVVPLALVDECGLVAAEHWKVYVPALVLGVATMIPLMILSARKHLITRIFVTAIGILVASQAALYLGYTSLAGMVFALWLFFWGFNTLEALLPSLISRIAPAARKGTAIGVYNTFEFSGVFLGGLAGGWVHGQYGIGGVFLLCATVLLMWAVLAFAAPMPKLFDTRLLRVGTGAPDQARLLAQRLSAVPGVMEAIVIAEEGVAYLKIDRQQLDEAKLRELAAP